MNPINRSGRAMKKMVFAIALFTVTTIAVSAQNVAPQSQGKMYGDPGFRGEVINLNVVNADIREILSYITDQYGINFVIDKSVKEVPVTVKVNDVPWNIALDSVLQAQELGVQVNGTILRVADNKTLAAEGELFRERMNNQLDTSPLFTELIRLNYATAAGGPNGGQTTSGTASGGQGAMSGMSGGGGMGGGMSGGMGGGMSGGAMGGQGANNFGLLPIVQRRLSRRGSIEVDARSNSLIITDVATNISAIKQLIEILDQPEPQVEIEARIVVASRNFSRDIGFQLAALVTGARGSGILGGTLPTTGAPPAIPQAPPNNSLFSNLPNTVIGLTTGIFGTAEIKAMLSLGEQQGQAKIIATPRVSTLNNHPAEIKSGTQIPITTIQPGGAAGGALVATTTYIDVPLRLAITPQITGEDTVILNVVAENSSTATVVAGATNPAINTQSMTTTVTVPDGGTTVVGGVLFDDERDGQDRTPGLSRIPIFGNLFKRKSVQRNTNEILFFITPRIMRVATSKNGTLPTLIPQPVPMGNPPSNSTPAVNTGSPVVFPSPGVQRPEPVANPQNRP